MADSTDAEKRARFNLEAFTAVNDMGIKWLDAVGRHQKIQVEVLQGRIKAARDYVALQVDLLELRNLRVQTKWRDIERRRLQQARKVLDRMTKRIGYLLNPGSDTQLLALANAAYRYFYRRASHSARVAADIAPSQSDAIGILSDDASQIATEYKSRIEELLKREEST